MNNKGFTLVELLGVIIILSLLMLIVLPRITNSTRNSSTKTDKLTEDLIFNAVGLYLNDNEGQYGKIDGSTYCVLLSDLVNGDYLKSPIKLSYSDDVTNTKVVEANYNNGYSYELKDNGKCSGKSIYVDSTVNGAYPELMQGLTPVVYENNNWKVADTSKKWYDYSNQNWANAVILNSGVTKSIGQTINVASEVKAMFVWIPRYEYRIQGKYGKGGTSATTPGEIEVRFVSKNKTKASNDYIMHPAFTFGDEELNGIWVGKFKTSHTTLSSSTTENNLGCSNENCTNADGLRILPNVKSLRYNNISNFFFAARSMTRNGNGFGLSSSNTDSHLMKNSEWGAVAYLSQSKYGKYGNPKYSGAEKQVRINNCSSFITGIGADRQNDGSSSSTCTINTYETTNGKSASTTGNISGIYDMSGGSWQYVMVNLSGVSGIWDTTSSTNYAGFTSAPNAKYYDSYTSTNLSSNAGILSATACGEGVCYGHALSETMNWYGDYSYFASSSNPWITRGGHHNGGATTGVFSFNYFNGSANSAASFRIVIS